MSEERAFREIKDKDGEVLCTTPDKGGPVLIEGQHPEDYYQPDKDGIATQNAGSPSRKKPAPLGADGGD